MDQLNSREQQEFQQLVERKQMKDFMRVSWPPFPTLDYLWGAKLQPKLQPNQDV